MMESISTLGALIGLALTIFLIIIKINPVYAIILGALSGGLCGGYSLEATIQTMFTGTQSMAASGLRVLTSGVLVGALVTSRSTDTISISIIRFFGEKRALIAIALAAMLICAIGVFIPVAVITIAPIALDIKRRTDISTTSILIALIGGGKAGNIISLNPNTIAVAEAFQLDVIDLIAKNLIPAAAALAVTIILALSMAKTGRANDYVKTKKVINKNRCGRNISAMENRTIEEKTAGRIVLDQNVYPENSDDKLPNLLQAIAGPVVVIVLLLLKLIINVNIDTLIALPAAGLVTLLVTGNIKKISTSLKYGISKVSDTFLLLLATGTIAGVINESSLISDITSLLNMAHLPVFLLAPLSGMLLAAATASTTAGATIASQAFSSALLNAGVPALTAGAMINASATIIDSMPHGSFFHASADAVGMNTKERLKLLPIEVLVGLSATVTGILLYVI